MEARVEEEREALLDVRHMGVTARSGPILHDISLKVYEREMVSLVGPSGAGKTTVLRVLNRLADLESKLDVTGEVFYRGRNILSFYPVNDLRRRIGLVFQKPCVFPGSILRNVLFGVRHHRRLRAREALQFAECVLRKAHLWNEVKDRLGGPASQLSLGQKQRLAFGRVLAVDPDILLLDEPTSSLDPHSTHEIEQALLEMKRSKSIVLVTHLLEQSRRVSDRVIFMSGGRIVEAGPTSDLFESPQYEETRHYLSPR